MSAAVQGSPAYIVRHVQLPEHDGATGAVLSQVAVATLEKARRAVAAAAGFGGDRVPLCVQAAIRGTGDHFPLTAGVRIEVDAATYAQLYIDVYGRAPDLSQRLLDRRRELAELVREWNLLPAARVSAEQRGYRWDDLGTRVRRDILSDLAELQPVLAPQQSHAAEDDLRDRCTTCGGRIGRREGNGPDCECPVPDQQSHEGKESA